jgi:fimbrial chaperone protein
MTRRNRHGTTLLAIVTLLLGLPSALLAHSVQPMRFDLRPSGPDAQTTMTIDNTRAYPITIEIAAFSVDIGPDEREVLAPADDDFLIFPPQMIIEPSAKQSVRVRYVGDPTIENSRTYRVNVDQVAIDMSGRQEPGVAVAVNFATLANVVPDGARSQIAVDSIEPAGDGNAVVTLTNQGRSYARLLASTWTLEHGGRTETFDGNTVAGWLGEESNLVLPGATRTVTVPLPAGFDAAGTSISIRTETD